MYIYSTLYVLPHSQGIQAWITQCYLQLHQCIPLPHKRSPDGASPDWGCRHLIAAYYSFIYPKGRKAESAWLADIQRTVYPVTVSCRSSAGHGKFAAQRPTFYHCTTQPYESATASVLITVTSQVSNFPACHGIWVAFTILTYETYGLSKARATKSFNCWCLGILLGARLQTRPCKPQASTSDSTTTSVRSN